jgi:hypothetical protein
MTVRWLVALAVVCASGRVAADPAIVLVRCAAIDLVGLKDALAAELTAAPPERWLAHPTIVVHCSDAMMVHVAVEPRHGLPIARSLDLDEVPDELRLKFLAIAAVEMMAIDQQWPPRARVALASRPPPLALIARTGTQSSSPTAAITPRAGVRWYGGDPLAHVAVDVDLRWLSIGLAGSMGSTDYDIGSVTPYVLTATASTPALCAGRFTRGCLRGRGEFGLAGVTARGAGAMVRARDASVPYAQLGVRLDGERLFGSLSGVVAIEAGWAEGLIANIEDRDPVRLDGLALTVLVGLRWRR